MELEQRSIRIGASVIACMVVLRMLGAGLPQPLTTALSSPTVASFILYLQTGRVVRPTAPQTPVQNNTSSTEPTQPPAPADPQTPTVPVFSPQDASLVEIHNTCGYPVDIETLLQAPLTWDLTDEQPSVLILHSHGSESYTKTESYEESTDYRTLNADYNMVSVGRRLMQQLTASGIHVLHDETLHDYPSYDGSYENARTSIESYLKQYPSIRLVLDLHRDAMEDAAGNQLSYCTDINGTSVAKLMFVVGTDAGGLTHPNWQANMALAAKLHVQLARTYAGICRPISFRSQRFNQDLSAGAVLVEIGAAGNTRQEALAAADILAEAITALANGSS